LFYAAAMIHRFMFSAMAGRNEILIDDQDPARARVAAQLAIDEVQRIEAKYSRYRADSVVSLINAQQASVKVDDETAYLLNFAATLHAQSGGLFDITSGVLRRAWRFESDAGLPAQPLIDECCALIGWPRVEWDATTQSIRLPLVGMQIDFGGFGKEYAADRAATLIRGAGIHRALVNLAGDVVVFSNSDEPWTLGIQHPREPIGDAIKTVTMRNGALATSGDYERYLVLGGKRYCHILNPMHGWPSGFAARGEAWAQAPAQSVSVIAPNALVAGGLSTVAMLKPASEAKQWLTSLSVEPLVVSEGRVAL
jgi:FAD:protein FMN transferase